MSEPAKARSGMNGYPRPGASGPGPSRLKFMPSLRDRALRQRVIELNDALDEALDLAEEGWAYASDYFRDKWEFEERRDALERVLSGEEPREDGLTDEEYDTSDGHA